MKPDTRCKVDAVLYFIWDAIKIIIVVGIVVVYIVVNYQARH